MGTYTMGRDEKNFDKPEQFLPERWMRDRGAEEAAGGRPANHRDAHYATIPFAFGPRCCVGKPLVFSMVILGEKGDIFRLNQIGSFDWLIDFANMTYFRWQEIASFASWCSSFRFFVILSIFRYEELLEERRFTKIRGKYRTWLHRELFFYISFAVYVAVIVVFLFHLNGLLYFESFFGVVKNNPIGQSSYTAIVNTVERTRPHGRAMTRPPSRTRQLNLT